MSPTARALLAEMAGDDDALDELARLLAPRLAVQTPRDGYATTHAAAEYLGLKPRRLYELASSGALEPDGRDGRTLLYSYATLDRYVVGHGKGRP